MVNRDLDGERNTADEPLPEFALDGRTKAARRFRRLVKAFEQDLGGDLSHADRSLVRCAATLALRAEQVQSDLLSGKPVNDEDLVRLSRASAHIMRELRAHRAAKKAPPRETFRERILREKREEQERNEA
ncbi:MAG: hypothetical protein WAK55_09905 [Xanthobacteraceae bacterium]